MHITHFLYGVHLAGSYTVHDSWASDVPVGAMYFGDAWGGWRSVSGSSGDTVVGVHPWDASFQSVQYLRCATESLGMCCGQIADDQYIALDPAAVQLLKCRPMSSACRSWWASGIM